MGAGKRVVALHFSVSSQPVFMLVPRLRIAQSHVVPLGREIGHAATRVLDDGPGNMNNVNQNENPIRQGLGLPPRIAY